MFALQSTPLDPGTAVVALGGLVLVALLTGVVGNTVVRRLSNPVGKYRLLYGVVFLPLTFLSYGLFALAGFGPSLVAALPSVPSPLPNLLGSFVEFLGAGVVWLAAYAPTVRGVRAVRGIDLPTAAALGKMARYVVGLSAVITVVVAPLRFAGSTLGVGVAVTLIGVGFVYASPWLIPVLRATRDPDDRTADRIADLRARAGIDVRDTLVLDSEDEETASTLVRGPPGYRRLFVTGTFLDAFDDDTAAALLAVEAGRLRVRVLERRIGTVAVTGLALVASVSGTGLRWPLLALSASVLLVGFGLSRRAVRAADDHAAERVGPGTVATALERYAEVHAMEPTRRRLPNPLSANVALGDRIDRLRARDPN